MSSSRRTIAMAAVACLVLVSVATIASGQARRPKCLGKLATKVGTNGANEIRGTNRADVIVAKGGSDVVVGLGGNDRICGGGGDDVIGGGGGADRLAGGGGNDSLLGDAGSDQLAGGGGSDLLAGNAGNDSLHGGGRVGQAPPFDVAVFDDATGSVRVNVPGGTATGRGVGTDTLAHIEDFATGEFDDTLIGTDFSYGDGFFANGGDDTLDARDGDDLLEGGMGNDTISGGAGSDLGSWRLLAPNDETAVTVDLLNGTATGQGDDTLSSIQNVLASHGDDTISGTAEDNELLGLGGADNITAAGGDDLVAGGGGNDTLAGDEGVDAVDHYGWAVDWEPSLQLQSRPVTVDLTNGTSTGQGSDTLSGFENAGGTHLNDTITGSDISNLLVGFDGNDALSGMGGDDTIEADCEYVFQVSCFVASNGNADDVDGGAGTDACFNAEIETTCETGPTTIGSYTARRSQLRAAHPMTMLQILIRGLAR